MASAFENSGALAGDPDGLERLWTPYRMAYIEGNDTRKESGGSETSKDKKDPCPFCVAPTRADEESLIVHRGETCYVIMNLYPYNPGHLLVCPYRHIPMYTDATPAEREEMGELVAQSMNVIKEVMTPSGYNLGINQGGVAGAGIADHLHQHVVPRWAGDSNFFPIIARTKAIPQLLSDTRERLAKAWGQMTGLADKGV